MRRLTVWSLFLNICLVPALAHGQGATDPVLLSIFWRVKVGGVDYMTSRDSSERNQYPSDGAIWYVPHTNLGGTVAFYRLYNASIPDHMDSLTAGESGYATEAVIGYPFTSSSATGGLSQMSRVHNTTDHATIKPGESLPGYSTTENFTAYGYARFLQQNESLLSLTAGGVTVQSNRVAGGAVWTWTWNGKQFINHDDYGREIQSALFYSLNNVLHNPTEAGDSFSGSNRIPEDRHGSPIVTLTNTSSTTQQSRSKPLEWSPGLFGGGGDNPAFYKLFQLGKDLTLDYNGMGAVGKYSTYVSVPQSISSTALEMPTAYLTSDLDRYYTYDAAADSLQDQTTAVNAKNACMTNDSYPFTPATGYGGVIITDSSGSYALGIYGLTQSVGGPVSEFTLWNLISCGNTSKWSAVRNGTIPSGVSTYNTWIVSGTLQQVRQQMHQLYLTP